MRELLVGAFGFWRWLLVCPDCGLRRCPVHRYMDWDMDHRGTLPSYWWWSGE